MVSLGFELQKDQIQGLQAPHGIPINQANGAGLGLARRALLQVSLDSGGEESRDCFASLAGEGDSMDGLVRVQAQIGLLRTFRFCVSQQIWASGFGLPGFQWLTGQAQAKGDIGGV